MRVVYNACYGGFSLSKEAVELLAKLKGYDLSGMKYEHGGYTDEDCILEFGYDIDRSDRDLITVVETLGEKANGIYAKLAIFDVPDGREYEIEVCDGLEGVVPPRQKW
jgi:hypothetical protein